MAELLQELLNGLPTPRNNVESSQQMFILGREENAVGPVDIGNAPWAANRSVRRPLGLEFKRDTFAYIEVLRTVVNGKGQVTGHKPVALFNENHPTRKTSNIAFSSLENLVASTATASGFTSKNVDAGPDRASVATYTNNFLIQTTNEVREEKFQLLETFGDNFVFFFGERPRFFEITGIFANANSHRWEKEFWLNYDNYLRGTRCVENQSVVTLHVDGLSVSGYMLTAHATKASSDPRAVQFSFRLLVTDYFYEDGLSNSLDFYYENTKRRAMELAEDPTSVSSTFGKAAQALTGAVDRFSDMMDSAVLDQAVSFVTQAMFGDPFTAISDGIAGAVNVYDLVSDSGFGALADVDEFKYGLGSLVEFRGRAPGLLVTDTGKTLQDQAIKRLTASVDNSLNVLLSLRESPLVKMVNALGTLIGSAISGLGGNNLISASSRSLASIVAGEEVSAITGRYMGFDFTYPVKDIRFTKVSPEKSDFRQVSSDFRPVEPDGADDQFEVTRVSFKTGSGVKFNELKAQPGYQQLPRAWRLRIEKDPDTMSDKLIAAARKTSETNLELVIRTTKSIRPVETDLSTRLRKALGS